MGAVSHLEPKTMFFLRHSPRWGLLAAVVGCAVVLGLDAVTTGSLQVFIGSVTFIFAVAIAASLGGWRPGLLATALCVVGYLFFFIRPYYTFRVDNPFDLLPLLGFVVVGVVLSVLCDWLRVAATRVEERQRRLEVEIAGHRQAQHALEAAEATARAESERSKANASLLRVTLGSIGDGVIATDVEGRVSFINAVAESLTGWKQADAKGRALSEIFQIVNERTRTPLEDPCANVLSRGTITEVPHSALLLAKDNREIRIADTAAPIFDESGRVHGVVLVFRDATAERAVTEALERLAAIVKQSSDAVIGCALDGQITSWNSGAERIYGYSPEEVIGKSVSILFPAERSHEFDAIGERVRRGEAAEHVQTVRLRKDGSRVDISLAVSPLKDADGEVVGVSSVARDITAQKRAEENLHLLVDATESLGALIGLRDSLRTMAQRAVESFADWCVLHLVSESGEIRALAQAHAEPSKRRELEEFCERYPVDWSQPSLQLQVLRSGRAEIVSDLTPVQFAPLLRDERHQAVLESLSAQSAIVVPLEGRGRVIGTLAFVRCGSKPAFTHAELQVALDLAKRAATAVENDRLYEELKRADRQKDDFVAMLAHELRNPLAAISYAAQVMTVSPQRSESAVEIVNRQVQQLSSLINDLLDVSRITRGLIHLRKENIDAGTLVDRALATTRPLIEQQGHIVRRQIEEREMPLVVDPTRVEQILVNLLINAGKYTPKGGEITVSAQSEGEEVVIAVQDTGVGIPREMLGRVFDMFTQINPSIDRTEGGLGIGLTVVRRLVEMHGGTVSAFSEGLGKGTKFTIRLPTSETGAVAGQPQPAAAGPRRGLRVLVVDDNVDTATTVSWLLKSAGCITETANDGSSAIDTARRFRPDVAVLDIGLPGLDGYEVARRIRASSELNRMKLIAITGYGQEHDRSRSKDAGFDHHLVKPVQFESLHSLLSD